MPLFNGNILQIQALLIAAYAGVAKGIANAGKKPNVCTTYPQDYQTHNIATTSIDLASWYSAVSATSHIPPPLPCPGDGGRHGSNGGMVRVGQYVDAQPASFEWHGDAIARCVMPVPRGDTGKPSNCIV